MEGMVRLQERNHLEHLAPLGVRYRGEVQS